VGAVAALPEELEAVSPKLSSTHPLPS
jgi:hypothetical protein